MADASQMFDYTKFMKDFDPKKMVEEFSRLLKGYSLPGVDLDGMLASRRKDLEALTQANRVAFEGVQAIAKRQAEILQETMGEASRAVSSLATAGSPPEIVAKQAELAKDAFEKALGNMRELAEMVAKSNQQATNTINARISASLDELKEIAARGKKSG